MSDVDDLRSRLDAMQQAMVQAIADLTTRVEALEPPDEREAAPPPLRWADRPQTTTAEWDTLVKWVDDLNRSYSISDTYKIMPCWPAHPGIVEELEALRMAWIAATIADNRNGWHPAEPAQGKKRAKPERPPKGGPDYSVWHDRALWPFLDRLVMNRYRISMCTPDHHVPEVPEDLPAVTNRSLIPVRP